MVFRKLLSKKTAADEFFRDKAETQKFFTKKTSSKISAAPHGAFYVSIDKSSFSLYNSASILRSTINEKQLIEISAPKRNLFVFPPKVYAFSGLGKIISFRFGENIKNRRRNEIEK